MLRRSVQRDCLCQTITAFVLSSPVTPNYEFFLFRPRNYYKLSLVRVTFGNTSGNL